MRKTICALFAFIMMCALSGCWDKTDPLEVYDAMQNHLISADYFETQSTIYVNKRIMSIFNKSSGMLKNKDSSVKFSESITINNRNYTIYYADGTLYNDGDFKFARKVPYEEISDVYVLAKMPKFSEESINKAHIEKQESDNMLLKFELREASPEIEKITKTNLLMLEIPFDKVDIDSISYSAVTDSSYRPLYEQLVYKAAVEHNGETKEYAIACTMEYKQFGKTKEIDLPSNLSEFMLIEE